MDMMKFNQPYITGQEQKYIEEAIGTSRLQGGGSFGEKVKAYLQDTMSAKGVFLVHSCTAALEIAALALDIQIGDEVIMPSYTYVSTANAFALRGAKIIFVDIDPLTMCLDLDCVEAALTPNTKAVVPVHYGSVTCDMDRLMTMADKHHFLVVEDAAQGIFGHYKGRALGTIGHLGCISCHETKNIHAGGEGGILLVNDKSFESRVAQIIEKGTDRQAFLNKEVSRYTWQRLGSSYAMSELHAAFLYGQLKDFDYITNYRRKLFDVYMQELIILDKEVIELFTLPNYNDGNGHLCYIKVSSEEERDALKGHLLLNEIETASHYEALHKSRAGLAYGRFMGSDQHTTSGAKRLLRLPIHMYLSEEDIVVVCEAIKEYYKNKGVQGFE